MRSARRQLAAHLQRNPTAAELAAAANLDERELAEAMRAEQARLPLSLTDAAPAVSADEMFDASEDRLLISGGFRALHRHEQQIVPASGTSRTSARTRSRLALASPRHRHRD